MNKKHFVNRLRADPDWAADVLSTIHREALLRWHRRWLAGKHPAWIRPEETVGEGFRRALASIPAAMRFDDVSTHINRMIDEYIGNLLIDAVPSRPRHTPRGLARRGRTPIIVHRHLCDDDDPQAAVLLEHIAQHAVRFEAVLATVKPAKAKRALTMLRDTYSLRDIREATGYTGPGMLRVYEKFCFILGLSA